MTVGASGGNIDSHDCKKLAVRVLFLNCIIYIYIYGNFLVVLIASTYLKKGSNFGF